MKLQVTETAAKWYREELQLEEGKNLHFYVRYGGVGGHQPGFSLAISPDDKKEPVAETTVNGITFFVENDDDWYFDGADLIVDYDEDKQEPSFNYQT